MYISIKKVYLNNFKRLLNPLAYTLFFFRTLRSNIYNFLSINLSVFSYKLSNILFGYDFLRTFSADVLVKDKKFF